MNRKLAYNAPPKLKKTRVVKPKPSYYERGDCIGSSILAAYIDNSDKAALPVRKNGAMSGGHIWEDWLEYMIVDGVDFWGKYYVSKFAAFPECKLRQSIPDLLDCAFEDRPERVKNAFIFNKGKDKKKSGFNDMLGEIQENCHKHPMPQSVWESIQKAWENFQLYIFTDRDKQMEMKLVDLLQGGEWQLEHFWNDSGVECRQKIDVWAPALAAGDRRLDLIFDIKFTSGLSQFQRAWKTKHIWQDQHYSSGFQNYLMKREKLEYKGNMYFIVTENTEPFMTRIVYMEPQAFSYYQDLYALKLQKCWTWLRSGKPKRGWIKPRAWDQYGREVS